ncbi:hypothetical protein C8R43DRAFT_953487 [Mycena crocata]|nr:hypothetical protein C8R43DRAFT_953487 [Mycena crocata]
MAPSASKEVQDYKRMNEQIIKFTLKRFLPVAFGIYPSAGIDTELVAPCSDAPFRASRLASSSIYYALASLIDLVRCITVYACSSFYWASVPFPDAAFAIWLAARWRAAGEPVHTLPPCSHQGPAALSNMRRVVFPPTAYGLSVRPPAVGLSAGAQPRNGSDSEIELRTLHSSPTQLSLGEYPDLVNSIIVTLERVAQAAPPDLRTRAPSANVDPASPQCEDAPGMHWIAGEVSIRSQQVMQHVCPPCAECADLNRFMTLLIDPVSFV